MRAQPSTVCAPRAAAEPASLHRQVLLPTILPTTAAIAGMARAPDVTVAAVAETAGRFLLVEERINRRLVFNQPAGHVERGETLLAAVVRETREETAWHFQPRALIGVYLWRNPANGRSVLRFAFTGPVTDHDATQRLDRGIVRTHWLTPAELERRSSRLRSPLVLRCVHDYLEGARHDLRSVADLDLQSAVLLTAVVPGTGGAAITAIGS
jgi:8-oxo-dGTP pyrophosphatase MutT (NUDIX family)